VVPTGPGADPGRGGRVRGVGHATDRDGYRREVPALRPFAVDPADEQRHTPDDDRLWNESYYLDFVSARADVGGYVRIGLYPNLGVTWWTTMIVGPDRPIMASVSYDLPVIGGTGLGLRAQGYDFDGVVGEPLRTVSVHARVPGTAHDEPAAVYRGDTGTPTPVEMDLTWTTDGTPYHYDVTTRYEVPCLVSGELVVGAERIVIDGQGQRDHSWGVRDWWAFGWCWAAARLDDGTRVHLADIRIPGSPIAFGYVQPGVEAAVDQIERLDMTEELEREGLPSSASVHVEPGGLDVEIQPLAFGPLRLVASDGRVSRFPRAMARFTLRDGRTGTGWIEWNQPESASGEQ
jgi:hypothetical protein